MPSAAGRFETAHFREGPALRNDVLHKPTRRPRGRRKIVAAIGSLDALSHHSMRTILHFASLRALDTSQQIVQLDFEIQICLFDQIVDWKAEVFVKLRSDER